ncbi:MAG: pyruvate kinase, partial [Syntrophomonadaceae bacterium]|nr:pyruvate kinase [Syntrophomonadaceae bacterium]
MAPMERASSGLDCLDQVLDGLRMGDNVVWQVDEVEDYRRFVRPFVCRALSDRRRLVYIRFGHHPALVEDQPGVAVYAIDPSLGFEAFSSRVHEIATLEGNDV